MIQMIAADKFNLTKGNHNMTLTRDEFGWMMMTENPCTRAWRSMGCKRFASLEAVEKAYKSWRGISALAEVA